MRRKTFKFLGFGASYITGLTVHMGPIFLYLQLSYHMMLFRMVSYISWNGSHMLKELIPHSLGYHPIWKQPDLPLHIRLDGAAKDLTTQADARRDHQAHVRGTPDHSGSPRTHEWSWTVTPVLPQRDKCEYCKISNIRCTKSPNSNVSHLCLQLSSHNIFKHLSQVLSGEWRCSWSSTDRRCSNYIWVINNLIAY